MGAAIELQGERTEGLSRRDRRRLERKLQKALIESAAQGSVEAYIERIPDEGPVAPTALLTDSGQLQERWRMAGHDPLDPQVREMIERGIHPVQGGATGLQSAAYMHNLPAEGQYVIDSEAFAGETERNDMPLEQRDYTGLSGAPIQQRISNVGVMTGLRVIFKGTLTVGGAGAVTATYQWPWNVIKRFLLNVQGQTSIVSCEGQDLRARRQRIYRNPREEVSTAPATDTTTGNPSPGVIANGTYSIVLAYDIPIVHDVYTLVGALYAQSDQVYLSFEATPAAQAEVFTVASGGTVTLTGKLHTQFTFYDIPYADVQGKGRLALLPDLGWLHGYVSAEKPFANTGEVLLPLIRNSGQLITLSVQTDNGGAALIDPLTWSGFRFQYGGNRTPRNHVPVETLIEKNVQDYNGRVRPGYAVLDFEIDNPKRDLVYPRGLTELAVVPTIPSGTTINANAKGRLVEETLFSGA